jgi:hypothetical protein
LGTDPRRCEDVDYGVTNDNAGILAGYAWVENVGWISFLSQVRASGVFRSAAPTMG